MIDHETGRTSDISPAAFGAQPAAIGYLRTDLCSYRGFVTARLRLTAIAHGYRLRWLVELPADPSPDHLTTLRSTLDRTAADAVIIVSAAHLPGRQFPALRAMAPVIVDTTVLPKSAGPFARLRTLLGSRVARCRISEWTGPTD